MKVWRSAALALPIVLVACESKKVEPEIEVKIDEVKLGRAIGYHIVTGAHQLVGSRVMTEQDLDMTLPSLSDNQGAGIPSVSLDIAQDGKLYGTNEEDDQIFLADEFSEESLAQAKAWLEQEKAQVKDLAVTIKVHKEQSQVDLVKLLNLLAELEINKVTFSDY